jgi:nucleotide sugar dehydrogenase
MKISIIGLGFVGSSMFKSFRLKGYSVNGYDKFKKSDKFENCLFSDIMFLALPTIFNEKTNCYDKNPIYETCELLIKEKYQGLVVIKSTVEPETTANLSKRYNLKFIHNPEFLTAATAFDDFHNQKHIVLGKGLNTNDSDIKILYDFYKEGYSEAAISICSSTESESMKIFLNCFYATKVQFFNEIYLLCKSMECDYDIVKELMLKNNWINPMHTTVPGPDGKLSYGGYCFPKDTNALLQFMKNKKSPYKVLNSVIEERNEMRKDNINIKLKQHLNYKYT